MKTPQEIKKGLAICTEDESCRDCPYDNGNCDMQLERDALALIRNLEKAMDIKENCTNCAFARDAAWQCQVCRWCNDKAMKIMWMQGPRKVNK